MKKSWVLSQLEQAQKGSIKNKNLIDFGGRTLLEWSVDAGNNCRFIDDVALSSDSNKILAIGKKSGLDKLILRPKELSTDKASSIDVVLHAFNIYPEYKWYALLQPTSPLRKGSHIDDCFKLLEDSKSNSIVSVCESQSKPNHILQVNNVTNTINPILDWESLIKPRQLLEHFYELNGAIYIGMIKDLINTHTFLSKDTIAYKMQKTSSVDIDNQNDLDIARMYLKGEV